MIKYAQATCFLKLLLQSAISSGAGVLKKMYLFGSVVTLGEGEDLDVILEVDTDTFEKYCSRIDQHWDYFSPQDASTLAAFEAVGFDLVAFISATEGAWSANISLENLHAICLPVGWDSPDSEAYKRLQGAMSKSHDPYFLIRAAGSCAEITV